jgi:hypothetical protein
MSHPDFYAGVPRGLQDNLQYRVDLRRRAEKDPGFQRAMLTACKHDILFWLSAFCWLYEPRPKIVDGVQIPKRLPFVPWEHQEQPIRQLREHLGFVDIGIEKSRGEGFSWIVIYLALHDWLFDEGANVGLVSRTEDEADDPENSDSLFWKIDWALARLPKWMAGLKGTDWSRNLSKHSLTNFRNGSQINADAATGSVFRGGRKKWALFDEFGFFKKGEDKQALASSQGATNSRLFVSTVNGSDNEYHRVMHEPSNMLRIIVDWKDNPSKNRGLYELKEGKPVAVDAVRNPLPDDYANFTDRIRDLHSRLRLKGFKLEGKLRSPWYDNECDRPGSTPQLVAQELDRDYGGSMWKLFNHDFFAEAEKGIKPPLVQGNLTYHPETLEPEFDRSPDGPMLLWCDLDHSRRPPVRPYVIGCDVATGLGGASSSNSTIQVIDLVTMEQVFEFADNRTQPSELADLAIAVAHWFHNAYLAWEVGGPGNAFTFRVLRRKYANVYYRRQIQQRGDKKLKDLGWATNDGTKEMMFSELLRAVLKSDVTIHSKALLNEFNQYVRIDGTIQHILSRKGDDDNTGGKSHGDRVIGFGVALMASKDRPVNEKAADEYHGPPPPNSMAARKQEWDAAQDKEDGEWDDRDSGDLAAGRTKSGSRWSSRESSDWSFPSN